MVVVRDYPILKSKRTDKSRICVVAIWNLVQMFHYWLYASSYNYFHLMSCFAMCFLESERPKATVFLVVSEFSFYSFVWLVKIWRELFSKWELILKAFWCLLPSKNYQHYIFLSLIIIQFKVDKIWKTESIRKKKCCIKWLILLSLYIKVVICERECPNNLCFCSPS